MSSATVWRYVIPWLFAIAIAANLIALATLTLVPWNGTTGLALAPSGQPFISRALAVSAPALGAGFRPGDLFDKRDQYRANGFANPVAGRSYTLIAHRGSQTIERQIIPLQVQLVWHESIRFLVILWLLLFAVLLARRAEKSKGNAFLLITQLALSVGAALDVLANKQGDGVGATLARIESSIERLGQEFRDKVPRFTEDTPEKTSLPQ